MKKFRSLLFLVSLLLLATACDRNKAPQTSTVRLTLPGAQLTPLAIQSNAVVPFSTMGWGQADPASLAEINCYAVAVALPEPSFNHNHCLDSAGEVYMRYHVMRAAVPAGAEISLDVPSGPQRTIYLAGFVANPATSCQNFELNGGPLAADLSAPFGLAKEVVDLPPGEKTVPMTANFDPNEKFDSCTGHGSPDNGTTPGQVQISPTVKTVGTSQAFTVTAYDGTPPYTYSIVSGPGSINSATGGFSSGSEGDVVIRVTDSTGQTSDGNLKVVTVGSLDGSMGTLGIKIETLGKTEVQGNDIKTLPDGKILVAGRAWIGAHADAFVARLNPNGSLDPAFGAPNGYVFLDPSGGADDEAQALDVGVDGKIVVVGSRNIGGPSDAFVARLNSDGSMDASFDQNISTGMKFIDINGQSEAFNDVKIDANGRIVVAGYMTDSSNFDKELMVGTLDTDGTAWPTFAGTGFVIDYTTGSDDIGAALTIDPLTGEIYVAGQSGSAFVSATIWKYSSTGSLVPGYGTSGRTTVQSGGNDSYFYDLALQSSGNLIAAGIRDDGNQDGIIYRFDSGGSVDATFGTSGQVAQYFNGNNDTFRAMVVQKDDKILGVGTKLVGDNNWVVVRYTSNGVLDTSFGGTGEMPMNAEAGGAEWDRLFGIALDHNGFVVTTGYANSDSGVLNGSNSQLGILRLKNDGN